MTLTDLQKELLRKYMRGEFSPMTMTDEEIEAFKVVGNEAKEWAIRTKAVEDPDFDDMIAWWVKKNNITL